MKKLSIYLILCFSLAIVTAANAQNQWKIVKPTNTGVPGDLVRLCRFDPQGNLWVAARWAFWHEGGVSKFDGTRWTAYSNVDSWMPTEFVNSIAFQSNGIAWIGTDSGLIRFDGVTAQRYNMNNAPFPSDNISHVNIDGFGNIWFISKSLTTTAHGVIKYDGVNWTVYNSSNSGIPYFDITSLGIDLNNNIWVGTWTLGIARFNGSQWTVYNSGNSGFNGGEVTGFAFPANGDVWVSSSGYGIYKFSNNVWTNVPGLPGSHSYSTIALHPDGSLWFGTYGGWLVKYNGSVFTPYWYGNHLYTIDFDPQGNVWAGGLAAIKKYVNGVNTLTYNVYNTSLTSYWVDAMDFQPNGKAWFATSMGGVCSYDGIKWEGYTPYNAGSNPWTFAHNSANDLFVDQQNGRIWVASNGVGYWDGASWTIFTLSNSNIPDNGVNIVMKDNQGRVWIGTDGYGAAFYDGSVWTRLDFGVFTSNQINEIASAPDGSVWFATDFGLHKTTDGVTFTTYFQSNSGLPGNYVNTVTFEANGTMWVGTDQGLAKFSNSTWTVYNQSNSGLPANFVSDIEASLPGIIWVSAYNTQTWPYYGGIAKYDGINWTTYTYENSPLTHYQVEELELDPTGVLWISTYSEGLMKLIPPGAALLPITLFSFTGEQLNGKVNLKWKTASEQNSDRFVVERANDSYVFSPIGTVPAAGSSQMVTEYFFVDNYSISGNSFYRLKMMDRDGQFTYSNVLKFSTNNDASDFIVYPNPVYSSLTIRYSGKKDLVMIKIYGVEGRLVRQERRARESFIHIDLPGLKPGTYIIECSDGERTFRQKIVKLNE
jgi:ligand-binding sensor domain-containing protein